MTKWIGIWNTAAVTIFMMSSLIHAAADIVTVDCSMQSPIQPPSNISYGGDWSQTFRINASTVLANRTCSFTLDARGLYALDVTLVTIGDKATTVSLYGLDQNYLQYNLNSSTTPPTATGFIATRVSISVHRGAAVTDDNLFNVTLTVDWHSFNYTRSLGGSSLSFASPWAVVDASKPGTTEFYASDGMTPRLYVVDFGNGTAEQLAANQGVLIYKTDSLSGSTEVPERPAGNYPNYMSSGGYRLPPSEWYVVYVNERYSANKLILVFMLDMPSSSFPNLYPITPDNVTSVVSGRYSSRSIMVLPHPSLAAVRLDNLRSSKDVSVVVGTPQILGIGPVIFNSSVSQLPEWSGVLVRSRLFTILGTGLNVTLTGVTTLSVMNAHARQRGVFMSRAYGERYNYKRTPDAQGYYINDVQTVALDNGTSARTISYQIDSVSLVGDSWISFSALDGSQATNYTNASPNLKGKRGSVKSSGLKLQSLSTSSSSYYLVRWTVSSATGQFLLPAVLALSLLTSLLFH